MAFLSRAELYPWLVKASCPVPTCDVSSQSSLICCVGPWRPKRLSGSVGPKNKDSVRLDVRVSGFQRGEVLTPLLPFLGFDVKHTVESPILHWCHWDTMGTWWYASYGSFLWVPLLSLCANRCTKIQIGTVDFYVWWIQPTSSYYRFVVLVPEVIIPSESHSLPTDDMMSFSRSNSSSKDTKTISPTLMSHRSMLHESQVQLGVYSMDLMLK